MIKLKMITHRFKLALYIMALAAAFSAPAHAEDGKRYEIEVLVFRNFSPELDGNELWEWEGANNNAEHTNEAIATNNRPPQNSALSQVSEKLREKGGQYSILAHKYWTQQIVEEETAKYIRVGGASSEQGLRIDGVIKLYTKQYLHADVDLTLAENGGGLVPGAPQKYRLKEHRRIQAGKIYYIDHPKFGVILHIK